MWLLVTKLWAVHCGICGRTGYCLTVPPPYPRGPREARAMLYRHSETYYPGGGMSGERRSLPILLLRLAERRRNVLGRVRPFFLPSTRAQKSPLVQSSKYPAYLKYQNLPYRIICLFFLSSIDLSSHSNSQLSAYQRDWAHKSPR